MTINKMTKLTGVVKWMLMNEIETRDNDDLLIALVETFYKPELKDMDWYSVTLRGYLELPYDIASIKRARRKIQEMYPELRGNNYTRMQRYKNQKVYEEYARTTV